MQSKKTGEKAQFIFPFDTIEPVRKCKFCGNLSTPKTETFSTMREDLDKERKAIMKQWAKREEQIECTMGVTWVCGDLLGIAEKSLQEIEGLELYSLGFNDKA
ncbi:MAG: hypothetical protein Q8M57_14195 [Nitrosomonas sp.]|uniref:DUF2130 domain-containing protein n=1 Tax=Nitrosomonas sp. TaxID=42353 RepID=UPI002728AFD5|nr:DUF2130 domain-containing protein [Nitrosomonas sp.]MDO9014742.1 hypothetical protein [Polynucleobacter sp.]MDP3282170.1 hypothetical protein [Nitrosomonas sp.]